MTNNIQDAITQISCKNHVKYYVPAITQCRMQKVVENAYNLSQYIAQNIQYLFSLRLSCIIYITIMAPHCIEPLSKKKFQNDIYFHSKTFTMIYIAYGASWSISFEGRAKSKSYFPSNSNHYTHIYVITYIRLRNSIIILFFSFHLLERKNERRWNCLSGWNNLISHCFRLLIF